MLLLCDRVAAVAVAVAVVALVGTSEKKKPENVQKW